jgi:serpin B
LIKRAAIAGVLFLLIVIASGGYIYMSSIGKSDMLVLDEDGYSPEGVQGTVDVSNTFGFELYHRYRTGDDNLFYSPYSISTALSMTYEGARGETAEQLRSIFHFTEEDSERWRSNARIYNILNGREEAYQLHTVNALWIQMDYPIKEEYIEAVENYYGGSAEGLDFVGKPDESRTIINDWVEVRTNNKIKDLFPPGSIDPLTRLVLTNAIYFKGDWLKAFNPDKTTKEDFHLKDGEKLEVDMMRMDEATFNYTQTEDLQILELPYKGKEISMIILLSKDNNLDDVEEKLDYNIYREWIKGLHATKLKVHLPKFKLETKYFMNQDLSEMGMPLPFTSSADFSGMTEDDDLLISKVIHQAYIEVDEKGTEAAAATGVAVGLSSMPSLKVFKADHPFIFTLQDRETGVILFMGRVMKP